MDIFFQDPDDPPVPPEEVRIRDFTAQPYSDGRRVRVVLEITPFEKRPSGEVTITNPAGDILAIANIIETMTKKMELTLHLRGAPGDEPLHATADIFYQDTPDEEDVDDTAEYGLPERTRVDMAQITFSLPDGDS